LAHPVHPKQYTSRRLVYIRPILGFSGSKVGYPKMGDSLESLPYNADMNRPAKFDAASFLGGEIDRPNRTNKKNKITNIKRYDISTPFLSACVGNKYCLIRK